MAAVDKVDVALFATGTIAGAIKAPVVGALAYIGTVYAYRMPGSPMQRVDLWQMALDGILVAVGTYLGDGLRTSIDTQEKE